jgi:hypothetical protein
MYNRDDGNDSPSESNMSTLSPDRPPQFNARNCNYDCGYGCQKDSEDEGGGAESDEQTVVGEEEENVHPYEDAEVQDESSREFEDLSGSGEWMPNSGAATPNSTGIQSSSSQDSGDDMFASMVVEPVSSGDHSPVIANSGSARSVSPNSGHVFWVAAPLPISYYFLQTPLRLSPQLEHCRGDPASLVVVPDRPRLRYVMGQMAREYAPAYRNTSPPRFEAY